jgi:HAD superfamily hydrolase (TIGR01484 family)
MHNLALYLYSDDKAYTEHTTAQSRAMFAGAATLVVEVDDLKQAVVDSTIKGLIVHPADEIEAMIDDLRHALGDGTSVFRSVDTLIEITSRNASKGRALSILAAYYGIAQGEVMAIGDHDNDRDMISWAGLGVAVGNASQGAKAVADYVVPPLSQEGAAWAIEHFILQQ